MTPENTAIKSHSSSFGDADIVLVVDDAPDNLFLTESILSEDGYEVICVEDGESALSLMESLTPDLVLLDVMMPGIDGYEVTRRIRASHGASYIPILLVTAHDRPCVVDGLDAGADDFIRKPIVEVDELLARVRSLLRLKHTIDERDQIARQREDFVSRLTHDLRTPLIAADRMLTMINQGTFGDVSEPIHESISTIIRSNESLLAMVNTWLEVYRHDAGSKSLTFSRFNLSKLIDEVIDELMPLALEKEIQFRHRYGQGIDPQGRNLVFQMSGKASAEHSKDLTPMGLKSYSQSDHNEQAIALDLSSQPESYRILGDRLEMRRVLINIIGNAIKFTDEGAVEVIVELAEPGNSEGETDQSSANQAAADQASADQASEPMLLIHVQDSGAGISEDDQEEIFERFRQGRNKRAGSGLGLHLARRIIEAHNGSIEVSSRLGQGSLFTIQLPVNAAGLESM
ncbi:MAG: hybrid sensor histidine kinase/response regulator [Elainellaceae cyanobacterium]